MSSYSDLDDPDRPQFSVFMFHEDESYLPVLRWVNMKRAQAEVQRMLKGPANTIVYRLIITDGGDHCVFEWIRGKGVTWPKIEPEKQ